MNTETSSIGSENAAPLPFSAAEDWLQGVNSLAHAFKNMPTPAAIPSVAVGRLSGFDQSGQPLVNFSDNPELKPVVARATCALSTSDAEREVVLVFENNDPNHPIVLGLLHPIPYQRELELPNVFVDGKELTLNAENEIVLRCGKASITLTRAGKVLISGEYLLSRSNGVNRIKGGSVQIN
jgi:hypothetical protein